MNLFKTFAVPAVALCLTGNCAPTAYAQLAQNWKAFKQVFADPRFPSDMQIYQHQVALGNGKFVTKFYRDFGTGGLFTGVVTADLADIDAPKMKVVKGKEKYSPEYWYLYVPVKNPNKAPNRVLATPKTDRSHLIVKDQVSVINGRKTTETWILTQMYLNFDNETAARQAQDDITRATQ